MDNREIVYGIDETMRLFNISNQWDIITSRMDQESYTFLEAYTQGATRMGS